MTIRYRADIDGLRAVAVLIVVLFHAGAPGFSGGYIGVDVFFVISGYLITSIIVADASAGEFSIARFYERRVRRILPALFTVLLITSVLVVAMMLPVDAKAYGKHLVATVFFLSNLQFLGGAGYFAGNAAIKPLLHTWSLAVEEQYYVIFPLFAVLLIRRSKRLLMIGVIAVGTVSLIASSIALSIWPAATFYLAPYRAWELMMGGVLAIGVPPARNQVLVEIEAIVGLALILIATFFYSPRTPFPGLAALMPVVGAALLIHANTVPGGVQRQSLIARLLSLPPVVWIGLISYPLYLWHWPVLVFARYWVISPLTPVEIMGTVVVSFVLAYLSYRFVERPFRSRGGVLCRNKLFAVAGGVTIAFAGVSAVLVALKGWPQRFSPEVVAADAYQTYNRRPVYREGQCFFSDGPFSRIDQRACLSIVPGKTNLLLWGDSHAAHYAHGLARIAPGLDVNVLQATGRCLPLAPDYEPTTACKQYSRDVVSFVEKHPVDIVVLSGYWLDHGSSVPASVKDTAVLFERLNRKVIVIGPSIVYQMSLPSLLSRELAFHSIGGFDPAYFLRDGGFALDEEMRRALSQTSAAYVSVFGSLCPMQTCPVKTPGGQLMEWDYGHLTAAGSDFVSGLSIAPVLASVVKSNR